MHLGNPAFQVFKAVSLVDRVAQNGCMGPSIEDFGYGTKGFLACRVPNLQFKHLILDFDKEASEFDPDRHIMFLFEFVLNKAFEHTRLADTCIPNDNQLEKGIMR